MNVILETERLMLRELNLNDSQFMIELLNSPGWLQFIGDRNVRTETQSMAYLEHGPLRSYRENGFGLYLVERKSDHLGVGLCGILKRDFLEVPDIGFAFLPEFNGMGYAYESAGATMKYATDTLKIPHLCAITTPENVRSIRLLEKIGLKLSGTILYPETNEELLLFSTKSDVQVYRLT